jgi:hypothetical protein
VNQIKAFLFHVDVFDIEAGALRIANISGSIGVETGQFHG